MSWRKGFCGAAFFLSAVLSSAQLPEDVPLGIEALTGLRTQDHFRGQEVSDTLLEFQLQTELTLASDIYLGLGGLYAAEGGGDFRETSGYVTLTREFDNFALSALLNYRNFDSSAVETGLEFGARGTWTISDDFSLSSSLTYDGGADGFYLETSADYSQVLSSSSFWNFEGWVGASEDYYGLSGLVAIGSRLSLTYNVTQQVSVTPFVTAETSLDSAGDTTLAAGFWFLVNF